MIYTDEIQECNYTEMCEYGVMFKYNIISSGTNIQYVMKPNFNYQTK